jgi:hypothetical protein
MAKYRICLKLFVKLTELGTNGSVIEQLARDPIPVAQTPILSSPVLVESPLHCYCHFGYRIAV